MGKRVLACAQELFIGTSKKNGSVQFAAHPTTIVYESVIFHEDSLVGLLAGHVNVHDYNLGLHNALVNIRSYLEQSGGVPPSAAEHPVAIQNTIVDSGCHVQTKRDGLPRSLDDDADPAVAECKPYHKQQRPCRRNTYKYRNQLQELRYLKNLMYQQLVSSQHVLPPWFVPQYPFPDQHWHDIVFPLMPYHLPYSPWQEEDVPDDDHDDTVEIPLQPTTLEEGQLQTQSTQKQVQEQDAIDASQQPACDQVEDGPVSQLPKNRKKFIAKRCRGCPCRNASSKQRQGQHATYPIHTCRQDEGASPT